MISYAEQRITDGITTITVLMENRSSRADVHAEHGLSFHIRETGHNETCTLFDTGPNERILENEDVLGLDLSGVTRIVLSHGHYDHTGGLPAVLDRAGGARVFCHPDALQPRYSVRDTTAPRAIGIPAESLIRLREHSFIPVRRRTPVTARLHATGEIPRSTTYEDTGGPFFLDQTAVRPDPIEDDQALWFVSGGALVILLGCAHAGVINTVETCREQSGVVPVRAIIGGFHLVNAGAERLDRTVEALRGIDPEMLAPCHCTGDRAMERLRREFPRSYREARAGDVFSFS